tara:strand:+ start:480 stop:695 length:216 start_codon:yes stop_codon:yes gene_type:complete
MERDEIRNTLGDADLGYMRKNVKDGDLSRGHFDASPEPHDEFNEQERPILGGGDENHGFLHRPLWRGDVER